jgi:hypothetical protein
VLALLRSCGLRASAVRELGVSSMSMLFSEQQRGPMSSFGFLKSNRKFANTDGGLVFNVNITPLSAFFFENLKKLKLIISNLMFDDVLLVLETPRDPVNVEMLSTGSELESFCRNFFIVRAKP